jgi:arabinogalactan oligomer/maltooligosaccharide transport system permease protein
MQELIARFGGTPALILKILFLGAVNSLAIWALPTLFSAQSWVMLFILVVSTIALDYIFLTKRLIPAKYVIIGTILLVSFQIVPIIYNVSIAFTNYSTGNVGTKEDAVATIERDSAAASEDSAAYDMVPVFDQTGALVLLLSPQTPIEDTTGTEPLPTDEASTGTEESAPAEFGAEDTASAPAEFGAEDTASAPAEFGAEDTASAPAEFGSEDTASSAPAFEDTPTGSGATGTCPVTYVGTTVGLEELPPSAVQCDEFGLVTGAADFETVPDTELPTIDAQLAAYTVPGPAGGVITPQGYSTAIELLPTLEYDPATSTFTSLGTGVQYVDNGEGSFANPDNPEDYLVPGWREFVGMQNFASVFTDEQIRDPFISVFIWTFVYAVLSVLLTFILGLGLAITLNKPGMKGQRIYRSILIVPYAVPAFLSILVWAGLLNDDFGAINVTFGLDIPWLFDPFWAKVSVLLVNLWLGFAYMFLVSTGALQAIPPELQEAARIDGARNFQVFRLVNLPLLLVALTPLLIASFAFNFNNFNNIYLLTGGGPTMEGSEVAGATDILISYTYKIAFAAGEGNDYGLAAAISILIFMIVGTISAISFSRSKAMREER